MSDEDRHEGDEADEQRDAVFGIERRKALIGVVLALVLTAGAVAALGQVTSYGKLREALSHADKLWLVGCIVGELVGWSGYVLAYRTVAAADGGPRIGFGDAARIVTIGLGAYVIGSDAGGLGVDFWAMRNAGSDTHEAARRTLGLNTLQAGALSAFAAAGGAILLALGPPGHAALVLALVWVSVVPAVWLAATYVSSRRVAPRLLDAPGGGGPRPSLREPRRLAASLKVKLEKAFADAIGGVVFARIVLGRPWRYLGGVAGYPLFWLGDFLILWTALRAFGYSLDPAALVVAESTAWALTFVPLPGGGSGFSEATIAYTLHAVGAPLSEAIFAALVYRAVNFWLPIVPALALLPRVGSLRESLRRVDHAERDEDVEIHPEEIGIGEGRS